MIPFLDVGAGQRELKAELDAAAARVLDSGWYIGGPEVTSFEAAFAKFVEADHCVGVGNGLDALILALRAMGVGPGDEVIVPSHTFIATWLAVSQTGATLVPVEPEAHGFNIDPAQVEAAITEKTKVIVPVHLYGAPCDLGPILDIARQHGVYVLEDAAQAQGARYRGKRIGAHGHAVAWSFYPGKNLGAFGDAGALTTNDHALATRIAMLGNYGSREKYNHELAGVNSRLDPMQASLLSVKLTYLDGWNARRATVAARYSDGLNGLPLTLPRVQQGSEAVWHLYVVRTADRDGLADTLGAQGIQTGQHYPTACCDQGAYREQGALALASVQARQIARDCLSLPMGPHLSIDDVDRVIQTIRTHFRS